MKKIISVILMISLVLSMTGCSETELKFAEDIKSFYTNKSEFVSTADFTLEPDALVPFIAAMSSEDISDSEIKGFVDNFTDSARLYLDTDRKMNIHLEAKGAIDPATMYCDESIKMTFNNITVDLGDLSMRGNDIYISKKLLVTMEQLKAFTSYDSYSNDEYYSEAEACAARISAYDKSFGNKEYAVISYDDYINTIQMYYGMNVVNPAMSTQKITEAYINSIDITTEFLSDFNSGVFSQIENGVRFELNESNFDTLLYDFIKYAADNPEKASDYANLPSNISLKNYINMIYLNESYHNTDDYLPESEEDASIAVIGGADGPTEVYVAKDKEVEEEAEIISEYDDYLDLINSDVNTEKIKFVCDVYNEPDIKNDIQEFKKLCNNSNSVISLKYDIVTGNENTKNVLTDFVLGTKDNMAVVIKSKAVYNFKEGISFKDVADTSAVNMTDIIKSAENAVIEYKIDAHRWDYDYCKNCEYYYCPYCDTYFEGNWNSRCDICGEYHTYYDYDYNCDKQPGCEYSCPTHGKLYYGKNDEYIYDYEIYEE